MSEKEKNSPIDNIDDSLIGIWMLIMLIAFVSTIFGFIFWSIELLAIASLSFSLGYLIVVFSEPLSFVIRAFVILIDDAVETLSEIAKRMRL